MKTAAKWFWTQYWGLVLVTVIGNFLFNLQLALNGLLLLGIILFVSLLIIGVLLFWFYVKPHYNRIVDDSIQRFESDFWHNFFS